MNKQLSEYAFKAEDIQRERVERGLSWRQVAINLDLKSPDAARKAWVALTGTPHTTTQTTSRKPKGTGQTAVAGVKGGHKTQTPMWSQQYIDELTDEELDGFQSLVTDTITRRDITVERVLRSISIPLETVHVQRVTGFSFEGADECLVVHLMEGGKEAKARSFRVRDIKVVS